MKKLCYLIIFLCIHVSMLGAQERKERSVVVNVLEDYEKNEISDYFQGLSFEMTQVSGDTGYFSAGNAKLARMLNNLGKGIIRVGGYSSDVTAWTGNNKVDSLGRHSLTMADVDRFADFVKMTEWKVMWGLNLGENNPGRNADEAEYVSKRLGNRLCAFQISNEPDIFGRPGKNRLRSDYNMEKFALEWGSYYDSLEERLRKVSVAGPAIALDLRWVDFFLKEFSKKIKFVTAHDYTLPGGTSGVTWHDLLEPDDHFEAYLHALDVMSRKYGKRYRISEGNSVTGGGLNEVSDVFASALWGLEYMWRVADNNGLGVNFHGGRSGPYCPIVMQKGDLVPRPLYYGMLAFRYGAEGGRVVPAVVSLSLPNTSAFASVSGNRLRVTLINKSYEEDVSFKVQLTKACSAYHVLRLLAPSPASKTGVSFANSVVDGQGNFTPDYGEKYKAGKDFVEVFVPATSAAIVIIDADKF